VRGTDRVAPTVRRAQSSESLRRPRHPMGEPGRRYNVRGKPARRPAARSGLSGGRGLCILRNLPSDRGGRTGVYAASKEESTMKGGTVMKDEKAEENKG